jgi:hypothetical protein
MTTKTSRDEWALRVQRWARSGLSASAFAAREAVTPKALMWWRWKLIREAKAHVKGAAAASEHEQGHMDRGASFVRLDVPEVGAELIEIALGNGRVIRVPATFEDGALARVLALAEAP